MSVYSPYKSEKLLDDPTRLDYPLATGFVQYLLFAAITHFAWPIIYYKAMSFAVAFLYSNNTLTNLYIQPYIYRYV